VTLGSKISEKFKDVFQSGLAFQIFNRPVRNDQIWDIKIFWRLMEYNGKDIVEESEAFDELEDCLNDMLDYIHFETRTWKSEMPLIEDDGHSNINVWDWVITKEGLVVQVELDDQPDLPFKKIKRFASKTEAQNADQINTLVKELIKEKESNKASWDMYGSELCAGDMIGKENAISDKIEELRNEH